MKKNKFYTINVMFLISAVSILIVLIAIIFYALRFLSSTLFHSLSGASGGKEPVSFNIEKARKLGL